MEALLVYRNQIYEPNHAYSHIILKGLFGESIGMYALTPI